MHKYCDIQKSDFNIKKPCTLLGLHSLSHCSKLILTAMATNSLCWFGNSFSFLLNVWSQTSPRVSTYNCNLDFCKYLLYWHEILTIKRHKRETRNRFISNVNFLYGWNKVYFNKLCLWLLWKYVWVCASFFYTASRKLTRPYICKKALCKWDNKEVLSEDTKGNRRETKVLLCIQYYFTRAFNKILYFLITFPNHFYKRYYS